MGFCVEHWTSKSPLECSFCLRVQLYWDEEQCVYTCVSAYKCLILEDLGKISFVQCRNGSSGKEIIEKRQSATLLMIIIQANSKYVVLLIVCLSFSVPICKHLRPDYPLVNCKECRSCIKDHFSFEMYLI